MPARRKTMQEHDLNGSLAQNPARYADRLHETVDSRPLGDPPMHCKPAEIVAWQEIDRIAPPGVLAFADRLAVELAASLLASFRELGPALSDARGRRLESILRELGLTPASRSRVRRAPAEIPAAPNRFACHVRPKN